MYVKTLANKYNVTGTDVFKVIILIKPLFCSHIQGTYIPTNFFNILWAMIFYIKGFLLLQKRNKKPIRHEITRTSKEPSWVNCIEFNRY